MATIVCGNRKCPYWEKGFCEQMVVTLDANAMCDEAWRKGVPIGIKVGEPKGKVIIDERPTIRRSSVEEAEMGKYGNSGIRRDDKDN